MKHMGIKANKKPAIQAGQTIAGSNSSPDLRVVKAGPRLDYTDILQRYRGSVPVQALRSTATSSWYSESEYAGERPETPELPKVESVRLGKKPIFSPQLCQAVSR